MAIGNVTFRGLLDRVRVIEDAGAEGTVLFMVLKVLTTVVITRVKGIG